MSRLRNKAPRCLRSEIPPANALIVLCAGLGKRMGQNRPKMLIHLLSRPLLYWTLKNLERCPVVHSIVLVVPSTHRKLFEKKVKDWRLKKITAVVEGGRERTDSARLGLAALPGICRYVGIHDGARPFVSPMLVEECFDAAKKFGSAILAVPSKDTVKIADRSARSGKKNTLVIKETVEREQCWSAQTPQVFRRDIAEEIHKKRTGQGNGKGRIPTDDASLAEMIGYKVRIVPSSYENIKITTPDDLILAEAILRRKK